MPDIQALQEKMQTLEEDFQSEKSARTQKETDYEKRMFDLERDAREHIHDGNGSAKLSRDNIIPGMRASGSITFATNGATYELGTNFNPSSLDFYGFAVYNPGSVSIRSHVVGNAQLGTSYYYQPKTTRSVTAGGPIQNVIQSSSAFTIDSTIATPVVRTTVSEGHLISVEYPSGTIVARATVTTFGNGSIFLSVVLATNWSIVGNFVVT